MAQKHTPWDRSFERQRFSQIPAVWAFFWKEPVAWAAVSLSPSFTTAVFSKLGGDMDWHVATLSEYFPLVVRSTHWTRYPEVPVSESLKLLLCLAVLYWLTGTPRILDVFGVKCLLSTWAFPMDDLFIFLLLTALPQAVCSPLLCWDCILFWRHLPATCVLGGLPSQLWAGEWLTLLLVQRSEFVP